MTTDDILQSIHYTEPTLNLANLEQARQLLREHEAWVSVDLIITEVNSLIPETSTII